MNAEFALRTLIFLPVISFPFIYLLGRSSLRLSLTKGKMRNPARWLALAVMAVLLIPMARVIVDFLSGVPIQTMIGGIELHMDGIGILLSLVVVAMCFFVILFSGDYMKDEVGEEKYYALLVCMAGMVIGMVTTTDLFNLWVWFEAMAITPYVLVAFYHDRAPALEAGVKYLFQSAVGTMLVLAGILIVYSQTGSLCIKPECAVDIPMTPAILAAGVLFLIGFGLKSALVPMHTWLPDAHSQAPSGISAILSGVVIEAGLIALLRALDLISGAFSQAGTFLIAFSVANILIGNLFALRQQQIKRMLAYSSISHMGYIVLGIGITMRFGTINGAQGAFFHIFTHALMKGLAFMAVGALMHAYAKPKGDAHAPLMLEDMNGIAKRYPPLAFILTIALLSLAGLPPLAGFMSKWQIFVAGFETGNTAMILIIIFAALNSVLSLAYYAPLINRMYQLKPTNLLSQAGKVTLTMNIVFYILTILIVVIGIFPNSLEPLTAQAAQVVMDAFVHP